MQSFRQLRVWQKAHELTLEVNRVTARFPKDETYALTSQIKRSAASIGANIAEGCGRGSDADFCRFLLMAMGSASELENHLQLAVDLKFLLPVDYEKLNDSTTQIKRMLAALLQKVRNKT